MPWLFVLIWQWCRTGPEYVNFVLCSLENCVYIIFRSHTHPHTLTHIRIKSTRTTLTHTVYWVCTFINIQIKNTHTHSHADINETTPQKYSTNMNIGKIWQKQQQQQWKHEHQLNKECTVECFWLYMRLDFYFCYISIMRRPYCSRRYNKIKLETSLLLIDLDIS